MSPPLLGVELVERQSNVATLKSRASSDSILESSMELKERNYMGVSDCSSSVDSSGVSAASEESRSNLKATELRLGLPGCQSPERNQDVFVISSSKLDEKPLFPLQSLRHCSSSSRQKNVVSGIKRSFHDAMEGFSKSKCFGIADAEAILSHRPSCDLGANSGPLKDNPVTQPPKNKDVATFSAFTNEPKAENITAATNNSASVAKAQVVGWPPIRSFRKNSLATTSKNTDEADEKECSGALFVKVSMDGAPYLRKVDLRAYAAYQDLSSGLEKMFSCFTIGQCAPHATTGREMLSESKLKDLLHGSEYVLTYEDKDCDWMLVGDVPWEMFIGTCKRLRIMKGSDVIGLGNPNLTRSAKGFGQIPEQKLTSICP